MSVRHLSAEKVLPPFAVFAFVLAVTLGAFAGGVWGGIALVSAPILFAGGRRAAQEKPLFDRNSSLFALVVLSVFAAELPFSIDLTVSGKQWVSLATIFLPLSLSLSPRAQAAASSRRFFPVVSLAMAVGALALGGELLSGGFLIHTFKKKTASLTEYNRGMAHVVILSFALFAGLWTQGHKKEAAWLALVLLFPSSLTESRTAQLALMAGGVSAAAAFVLPGLMRRTVSVVSVALAGWPFYVQEAFLNIHDLVAKLPSSWLHRVEIWDYLSHRIAERPFVGWGLGTSYLLDYTHPNGSMYVHVTERAPYPHNFVVELWSDTGLPGMALGIACMLVILRRIGRLHPKLRPFALGSYVAAVTTILCSFDLWNDALWGAFALTAFAFGLLHQRLERADNVADA